MNDLNIGESHQITGICYISLRNVYDDNGDFSQVLQKSVSFMMVLQNSKLRIRVWSKLHTLLTTYLKSNLG
jgi:hypothetical protein